MSENIPPTPDMLVVLGKNIGIGSPPEAIRNNRWHLSTESRLNVIAAGELYRPGTELLFATGKTAGEDVPSEARAMRDYFDRLFPDVPEEAKQLAENSIDTAGNAEEASQMLAGSRYGHIGLLSVGYHVENARILFENYGVTIDWAYAAEEIVKERSSHHAAYVLAWKGLSRVRAERRKERVRKVLLRTIDPKGKLLRVVTTRSRA